MEYNNEPTSHQIGEDNRITAFYFMPNITDYKKLSPYAFRLYAHFKRVTGEEGKCWQSVSTISKYCKMSTGMVTKARKELSDAGLINIRRVPNNKGFDYYSITIRDIWEENKAHSLNPLKDKEYITPSPHEATPSPDEQPPSPHETSNTPVKNTPNKNTPSTRFTKSKASTPKKQRDELISRFKEKTGLDYPEDVPASTLQKFWWTPASDMISYAGGVDEAWDILRQLIERFDDKGLVFADINSFSKSFNGMIAQKKRGGGVKSFRPTEENDPYFDVVRR